MKKCDLNILFTSSGRRVSLIKKFKETFSQHDISGKIVTADMKNTAPSLFFGDKHFLVPRVTDQNYLEEVLKICKLEEIDLLIPLIDTELVLLAKNRNVFEEIGVKVMVSSMRLTEITFDKLKTYEFFLNNRISTPHVYSEEEIKKNNYKFPLLIKPKNGSSSVGVTKIKNEKELNFFKDYIPNAMIQEYVSGDEYTVDVMTDFDGNIKTIVPRLRMETRAGEVSKGVTKKDFEIINAVEDVMHKLPGAVGCITLQCFRKENGEITFIEINPRFGGGIPLSIEAGANFPLWTTEMSKGVRFTKQDFSWKEDLTMLRYDEAIFAEIIQNENKCISL
ncbi:ATP-grasp domain-containing protein [Bacillus aerolatus]|uniref:ATP-grasp domain-containing protein n=1 Tax=Bacillus aerolatus TaxID=2653354 RepID=A0A6I1FMD9_9BACI|nr:ATP-grasp domain-containing protein [Bacillus aerolatus]KAB7708173.1 ATP-grasp domain-containing protein [Bacillus aerolatus]